MSAEPNMATAMVKKASTFAYIRVHNVDPQDAGSSCT